MAPSVYLHIPFCRKKCGYCSFNSYPYDSGDARIYMSALNAEIDLFAGKLQPETLYIGGGTPTVIEPSVLAATIRHAAGAFGLISGAEVTLEANPGTLDGYDLSPLLEAGVNRVSLGAQSFNDAELLLLGRAHRVADTAASVKMLRDRGINNLGLDLIYGIPRQDMDGWAANVAAALECSPEHLSLYCLSVDEGTPLHRDVASGRLKQPSGGVQSEMYSYALETLEKAGYSRYEISNFALRGFECRHNKNYWAQGDYLGLGAGAFSGMGRLRRTNIAGVRDYADAVLSGRGPAAAEEAVSEEDAIKEFIMLRLRTREGLDFGEYTSRFGRSFTAEHGARMARLAGAGFIISDTETTRLSDMGIFTSNSVISEFF